jgi:hypothetical protein
MVVVDDLADGAITAGASDGDAPQNSGPSAPPPRLELEAKLAEEYRQVRLLCATIAGEASTRGERVCELGRQTRKRIDADFNVDDPNTPPRTSQKCIAVATLLRAMPTPSTPEACNLHRKA